MEFTGPKPTGTSRQSKPVTERRHSPRLVVHSPAYTSLDGTPPEKARDLSEIVDVSESGVAIQTSSPLQLDHNLNLCLDLSETKARINTTGRVVWSNGSGRAGIHFPKLSGQSLHQLREWLFVNVLTAFDHARGWTAPANTDAPDDVPSGPSLLHGVPQGVPNNDVPGNELEYRAPEPARESFGESTAIPAELEAGGYDRETALQVIAERALTLTRATGAAVALTMDEEMICQASAGSDAPPLGTRLQASSGFSGECVRTGRCLRCDDSETDDRVDRQGCRALGVRSIVAVPIRPGSRVAGLLEVFSPQPYAFSPQDISALQQLTATIVSVIGGGEAPSAAAPDPPQTPRNLTPAPRIEERRPSEVMAGTVAAVEPLSRPRFHKILLAAATIIFVLALLWLIAPWISSRISLAGTSSPVQEPQAPSAKPISLSAEVNDLAGLRKLAEQGDPAAQFALGARYATGEEVKQDYTEAVRWFALAADRGHILAQATLGAYYWAGRGVSPNLTKAYFWSALAQAGGDQASKYRVAVLTSRMSRSEILAAQQQAGDWLRNHQMANAPPSR